MKTIVSGIVTHACPYRKTGIDTGRAVLTFDGQSAEYGELADLLASYHSLKITHEELTEDLASKTGASVVTYWNTSGLEIEVRAGMIGSTV